MYLHILEWNGAYTHHPLDPRNKNLSFELLKFKLHMYFYIFRCVIWKFLIHINNIEFKKNLTNNLSTGTW